MNRTGARTYKLSTAALAVMALLSTPAVTLAQAQSDPNAGTVADTDRVKAETALVVAETARINAQAARDQARISALGLPSFEGTTTLGDGVGAMETSMLAGHAVHAAAETISGRVTTAPNRHGSSSRPPTIVLAGDEALDFSRISAIATEISAIDAIFDRALVDEARARLAAARPTRRPGVRTANSGGEAGGSLTATTAIAAISAVAGLLRSNTDVTAVDLPVISNRILATAVAAEIQDAIVPGAAVGPIDTQDGLLARLIALGDKRAGVQAARDAIRPADPAKPTDAEKARIAPLAAALARFDTFAARVTTADANGAVPIVQADRLSVIWGRNPRVLRVYVDKAGGSMINRTNLLTTLGIDHPIRISGGMIASFILTEPSSGSVISAGTITCRTTVSELSWVQRGAWGSSRHPQAEGAQCSPNSPGAQAAQASRAGRAAAAAE